MSFTSNNMLMISCASSPLTPAAECHHECDETSMDAVLDFDFDFCAESESASMLPSESPNTIHNEWPNGAASGHHLRHYYDLQELPQRGRPQAPSTVDTCPKSVRARSSPLPATTSTTTTTTTTSCSSSSYPASAPPPPAAAAGKHTSPPTRSIYKKPCSYDLRDDFLHAAPAAQAALARLQDRQTFRAPPSQSSARASTSASAPHLPARDAGAKERRAQGG